LCAAGAVPLDSHAREQEQRFVNPTTVFQSSTAVNSVCWQNQNVFGSVFEDSKILLWDLRSPSSAQSTVRLDHEVAAWAEYY
jgi:hypothetical protein